ncbi:hypothetical protein E6C50_04415 [Flavobacterium supellecticarium]|uniref:Uncharacterized protein n=1 Tax=Flavobacterium supellecticarium TaxID=2565924 RepID=A0A4S4A4P7_9FLAO|nr:hypothetical protein [Flavobacterium supellecticarium]THF53452.1 hypothetical protein E6C50_04415 [Flavobacterium supellecticarium]
MKENSNLKRDVTFIDSKISSIQRWFPYLEGFAEDFVTNSINHLNIKPKYIYEPFSGSGTVPIYALKEKIRCHYDEVNPFMVSLTETKRSVLSLNKKDKERLIINLKEILVEYKAKIEMSQPCNDLDETYKNTFSPSIYFHESTYQDVLKSKTFLNKYKGLEFELLNIAMCEALLPSSLLKRAGDIRFRRTPNEIKQITNFIDRTKKNLNNIIEDIESIFEFETDFESIDFSYNSKHFKNDLEGKIDFTFTSPPYLNGTNYIRNTKLELWFTGRLKSKKDLIFFRQEVVTAGINDVTTIKKEMIIPFIEESLNDKSLWYDRRIPKMVRDYFFDMKIVFENIYKYTVKGGYFCIDIGDSIYGGIHIPTDKIFIEILKELKFSIEEVIILRERKSKDGSPLEQILIVCKK